MFSATTPGGAGRCTVHLELSLMKVYRCVPGEETVNDERSMEDASTTV